MSMAANTCTKSITGALTLASAGTKDGVPCYKNVSGKLMEVVDPNTNPAPKSSWDMSAPFGFSVPGSTNPTQNSAASSAGGASTAAPTTQTFDPVADFKTLWAGKPGSTGPAVKSDTTTAKKSQAETILNSGGLLILICVVLVLLSVVTFVSTGSFLATLVVIAILIGVILLLGKLGILKIYFDDSWMLHIEYHDMDAAPSDSDNTDQALTTSPAPSSSSQNASVPKPVGQSEVFHIGGNEYTYEEAPAVCAAYDSELATYDQMNAALSLGAEWCAYGWSQGGMALYPTQQSTWAELQSNPSKSTACGRPGINGGYFDPSTKFGVNCYGPKPSDNTNAKYPLPLPGYDPSAFNQMVNKFRSQLNTMQVNAFNRSAWSGWNLSAHQ